MLDTFVSIVPEAVVKAKVRDGAKEVRTERRPPGESDLTQHLLGVEALGVKVDRAVCLDLDHHGLSRVGPFVNALKGLGLAPYYGAGTTRGARVWVFLERGQAEGFAKLLSKLAHALGFTPCEPFPNGNKPIILPFFGVLSKNGVRRPLYGPDGKEASPANFNPVKATEEDVKAASIAVELFLTALQKRPESRHDAAMAFLNVAARMGVEDRLAVLMSTDAFYKAWGLDDGTRTINAWRDELQRLVEAAKDPSYQTKRGIPFLRELGYTLPKAVVDVLDPWPAPQPLDTVLFLPDLPEDRLLVPEEVHLLSDTLARQLSVNRVPIAMAAMGVLSGVLANRGLTIRPDPKNSSWEEAPVLWVVLIGPSGAGKTPILREVGRPLWDIERVLAEGNSAALNEFEAEIQVWASKKKEERGPRPTPPEQRRLVVTDTTPEALAAILSQNRGLISVQDELKALLASWAREDRTEGRALYLSAYSGHAFVVDRKTQGTLYLERPMLALVGGIQPGPWNLIVQGAQGLTNTADGLLQRITPVILNPGTPLRNPPPLNPQILGRYKALITKLFEEEGATLTLSQDAIGLWGEWVYETRVEARKEEHPDSWRGYLSKRAGLTARLAGITAMAKGEKEISRESLAQAIGLVLEVLEPHAKAAWRIEDSETARAAQGLIQHLGSRGVKEFRTRDVYRGKWAGITDARRAKEVLYLLQATNWVQYDQARGTWVVNPHALGGGHAD